MLGLVVGAVALLLVVAGIAIIAGPMLPRLWSAARAALAGSAAPPRTPAALPPNQPALTGDSALHPTTLRALTTAARAYSLLRAGGHDGVALELRSAARRVRADEAKGLLALATVLPALRETTLPNPLAEARYRQLVKELRDAVKDRSEQLELLHFR